MALIGPKTPSIWENTAFVICSPKFDDICRLCGVAPFEVAPLTGAFNADQEKTGAEKTGSA
jgi:hypothetical protein